MRATLCLLLAATLLTSCNCGGVLEPDSGTPADAGPPDAGPPDAGPPDAGPPDAGPPDAGPPDAGPPDAGPPDAGPPDAGLNALYAHLNGRLGIIDLATGAFVEVGPTGQPYSGFVWDESAGVARTLIGNFSPVGGAPTPRLGTLDLCTGSVDAGPALTVGGVQVRRAESIVRHPDSGVFVITVGRTGTGAATQFQTESNGTVDVSTGAVTINGNHQTLQDDGDWLTFVGPTLHLLDVDTNVNRSTVYVVDQTTGAATSRLTTTARLLRIAWDPTRQVMFVAYGEGTGVNRGIGTINLDSGVITPLGAGVPNSLHPNNQFVALVSVPAPRCP